MTAAGRPSIAWISARLLPSGGSFGWLIAGSRPNAETSGVPPNAALTARNEPAAPSTQDFSNTVPLRKARPHSSANFGLVWGPPQCDAGGSALGRGAVDLQAGRDRGHDAVLRLGPDTQRDHIGTSRNGTRERRDPGVDLGEALVVLDDLGLEAGELAVADLALQ